MTPGLRAEFLPSAYLLGTIHAKPPSEQGRRSGLGTLSSARARWPLRLEAACQRGLTIDDTRYRSIASILRTSLDKAFLSDRTVEADPIHHGNIRRQHCFH